jgi:hypothetical protein
MQALQALSRMPQIVLLCTFILHSYSRKHSRTAHRLRYVAHSIFSDLHDAGLLSRVVVDEARNMRGANIHTLTRGFEPSKAVRDGISLTTVSFTLGYSLERALNASRKLTEPVLDVFQSKCVQRMYMVISPQHAPIAPSCARRKHLYAYWVACAWEARVLQACTNLSTDQLNTLLTEGIPHSRKRLVREHSLVRVCAVFGRMSDNAVGLRWTGLAVLWDDDDFQCSSVEFKGKLSY